MIKKMFLATTIFSCCFLILYYILTNLDIEPTYGLPDEETTDLYHFTNQSYFYYINDDDIYLAIRKGTESLVSIEDHLLPNNSENSLSEDIILVYMETPFLKVLKKSQKVLGELGRVISIDEAKEELTDENLSFVIRFRNNSGYVYNVSLEQGKNVHSPYHETIRGNGGEKIAYFQTAQLLFDKPATLIVSDPLDKTKEVTYQIDFSKYK